MMRWFCLGYWKYLFSGCKGLRHFVCRVRNHPHGVHWYNIGGLEPNMHCVDCGDDLG